MTQSAPTPPETEYDGPVASPFQDPLLTVTDRLRVWIDSDRVGVLLAQMGMSKPSIAFGFTAREQLLNQGPGGANRIVLVPGSWPDGANQGKLVAPRQRKGPFHRVNATWECIFTISAWGVDNTDTADEEKQRQAASSIMNLAHAGLREVLGGDFPGIGDVFRDPKVSANLSYGAELLMQLVFYCEMRGLPQNVSGTPVTVVLPPKS